MQDLITINDASPELEEAILGALMVESASYDDVEHILKPELFYNEKRKTVFVAILTVIERKVTVDMITIVNELVRIKQLDFVGGAFYISTLASKISSASNIQHHAMILYQKYMQRQTKIINFNSTVRINNGEDILEVLSDQQNQLEKISTIEFTADKSIASVKQNVFDTILASGKNGGIIGIPSGLSELDKVLMGFQPKLYVIASRPGAGKSSLIKKLALEATTVHKKNVALFSLEMDAEELMLYMMSELSGIDNTQLQHGGINEIDMQMLKSSSECITDNLIIDDTPAITFNYLRKKCRAIKKKQGLDMVIIDYFQLMTPTGDKNESREQKLSKLCASLKRLSKAKELNVPIILLSQLNRDVDSRKPPIPNLSDLRETGALEQDANCVIFIYRPWYYKIKEDEGGHIEEETTHLIIAKNRGGKTGSVKIKFIGHLTKFTNLESNEPTF